MSRNCEDIPCIYFDEYSLVLFIDTIYGQQGGVSWILYRDTFQSLVTAPCCYDNEIITWYFPIQHGCQVDFVYVYEKQKYVQIWCYVHREEYIGIHVIERNVHWLFTFTGNMEKQRFLQISCQIWLSKNKWTWQIEYTRLHLWKH